VLPAMAFDEVGQRLLFGGQRLHSVRIHTILVCGLVNEICQKSKADRWTSVAWSLALNCLVPASQTLLFLDPRPLVEQLGVEFFSGNCPRAPAFT